MPNAFSDVNFIPDDVVSNRKHDSQIKSLNKIAVVAMVVSLLAGVSLFGYNYYTKNKISLIQTDIETKEVEIQKLNEFAESGYKLGLRLAAIKGLLDKRSYYGKIISQVYEEIPRGVTINTIQVSDKGATSLSGESFPNYIPIATFQDNLKNSDSEYFTNIRLKSASLDRERGSASFTIDFSINLDKTYEPIR